MPGLLVPRRRRAPGRHLGFTDVTLGGPFATPRARITVSCHWTSFAHSNRSGWRMVLGAVSGIETSSLRSSTGKCKQPGFHRADTCARASRQVSALFDPRTMTDSPALHPFHSSRSSPAFRRNSIGSMPGLCSFVPTAANWRDSQNSSCAPKKRIPEAARLRPARTTAIRREASPIAEDTVVARAVSPGQDDRNSRGDGPTFAALRRLRLRNWPTPLAKPDWSETPSLDSAACCLGLPWSPQIRPSFRYVPSAGTQIHWLRAGATTPGTMPADPAKFEN